MIWYNMLISQKRSLLLLCCKGIWESYFDSLIVHCTKTGFSTYGNSFAIDDFAKGTPSSTDLGIFLQTINFFKMGKNDQIDQECRNVLHISSQWEIREGHKRGTDQA